MTPSGTPHNDQKREQLRAQIGSLVFEACRDEKGVHAPSALCALGALSGFAVQMGLRQKLVVEEGQPETKVFAVVSTKSGETYYFGPLFDEFLLSTGEGKISVWAIVAGGAQRAGAKGLPNLRVIAEKNAHDVGTPAYGRMPEVAGCTPKETPLGSLRRHWPAVRKLLEESDTPPATWGWEIAVVAQAAIIGCATVVEPELAAALVMTPAISMSKIDPKRVLTV